MTSIDSDRARPTPAAARRQPKCPRGPLVGICLPDEVNLLRAPVADAKSVRRLVPALDDALPLYVPSTGARAGKRGEELVIELRDGTKDTDQVR